MKTADVKMNKIEIIALLYLVGDAASGWGEPFKDLDIDEHEIEWDDVDKAVASLQRKLRSAGRAVGMKHSPVSQ